jgi:hypothetical protein
LISASQTRASEKGFGVVGFAYPSTFYPSSVQQDLDLVRAQGSRSTSFRIRMEGGVYLPSGLPTFYWGGIFGAVGDQVVNNGGILRFNLGPSALYVFNPHSKHKVIARFDLGMGLLTRTGSLNGGGFDLGRQTLLGVGYGITDGLQLTADYSAYLGKAFYHSVTLGFTSRFSEFSWKNLLFNSLQNQSSRQ